MQIYVRTLCHMTGNTVLLIDEIESHLHTKWMNRFFSAVKSLIRGVPSLSVIFTTHNRELMRVFDHTRTEKGLIKGGYLIEEMDNRYKRVRLSNYAEKFQTQLVSMTGA